MCYYGVQDAISTLCPAAPTVSEGERVLARALALPRLCLSERDPSGVQETHLVVRQGRRVAPTPLSSSDLILVTKSPRASRACCLSPVRCISVINGLVQPEGTNDCCPTHPLTLMIPPIWTTPVNLPFVPIPRMKSTGPAVEEEWLADSLWAVAS